MLKVFRSTRFKKEYKKYQQRPKHLKPLIETIKLLQAQQKLPAKNEDHKLTGSWTGHRECHVLPDFLLIYKVEDHVLKLSALGSHSELFKS